MGNSSFYSPFFSMFIFYTGVHAEGTLWHTVFGLLFYDIIFDPAVDNVWFSETQV